MLSNPSGVPIAAHGGVRVTVAMAHASATQASARAGPPPTALRYYLKKSIRASIFDSTFKPGGRLNDSVPAREFNTSRIPVRGALAQLQEQGLVMRLERRSMVVITLSETAVQQVNAMRIILEAEAMKRGRASMTPAIIAELEDSLVPMDAREGPLADAAAFDRRFPAVIRRAAGNRYRKLHDVVAGGTADPQLALLAHLQMACFRTRQVLEPRHRARLILARQPRNNR